MGTVEGNLLNKKTMEIGSFRGIFCQSYLIETVLLYYKFVIKIFERVYGPTYTADSHINPRLTPRVHMSISRVCETIYPVKNLYN